VGTTKVLLYMKPGKNVFT